MAEVGIMSEEEENRKKVEDARENVIPLPSAADGGTVVDLRKERPREGKWAYLAAILIAIIFFIVMAILVEFSGWPI
jgi:hypothetical protein